MCMQNRLLPRVNMFYFRDLTYGEKIIETSNCSLTPHPRERSRQAVCVAAVCSIRTAHNAETVYSRNLRHVMCPSAVIYVHYI